MRCSRPNPCCWLGRDVVEEEIGARKTPHGVDPPRRPSFFSHTRGMMDTGFTESPGATNTGVFHARDYTRIQ